MASIQQLLQDIEAAPQGPKVTAIFDFDGTIISGYSATALIREQIRRGDLSPSEFLEIVGAMTNFGLGKLGFSGMMAISSQFMRGIDEDTYFEVGEDLYTSQIARRIYPESRALINAHLARGHTVAIISSATPYQVAPAARDLGIEHVLCTHLEVVDGKFTGEVVRPTCFGQGKVDAAEQLAAQFGADLDDGFFYSDSTDDQLLLERVGHPRALNPSEKLQRLAHKNNWPAARFGSRGRPSVSQFVRSVAATSSLVTSFAAGLPIYALTGSRRDSVNFSFSLFADTASALIGLDLNITGEQHLWSHRPCVFLFNHQSKADVVIIAKLLRRDIAGIGKKEIKREQPLIGKVLEFGGVVFIDRGNAKSAIESISPLVDAMRKEGRSVVLAPEGTRTVSPTLAPFKKGGFHIAMQAGVPIVPIVIRNAGDVAPKGDFVFRPATVDVEVLPPVDTSDWSAETIDSHVMEVRNMFARTLGQPELEVPATKTAAKKRRKAPARKKLATTKKAATKGKATARKSPAKAKARTKTAAKAKAKPRPKSAS
ncbi:HAD-IB family hydrolase [Seongchinamella sediminis]|uniref:HAD-IB family hydrolase n=1 Tax=Seongchinamella sediminis TaxID=2283635 RepID=A0A3L7E1J7_9GAMM|nr:HAD-IB family hydrolase [Seongchinamella sediminis]RLQ23334.1 HAD-IB family hydrolase [Seongchinamella sediminis]